MWLAILGWYAFRTGEIRPKKYNSQTKLALTYYGNKYIYI